ncbi:TetR/AcrR family transcriptional regulator [Agromyces sp. MMS24-JH15]|uniref:TetR/AcrR family transcriptional regulator n=1 Tax=Agromyces sp. MMS24-JH15 TaxID=3243765 RepID=UPI0037480F15
MDPRIVRTRHRLQAALLELAREHPLDDLTVADIAERAGVNRSSFYQHYPDKDTLLAEALDAALDAAEAGLPPTLDSLDAPPPALLGYLAHIEANAAIYARVLGDRGSALVVERVRARVERLVRDGVEGSGIAAYPGLPIDVVAAGVTGIALGVIRAWLDRDPRPSAEVAADWLWRMLLGLAPS